MPDRHRPPPSRGRQRAGQAGHRGLRRQRDRSSSRHDARCGACVVGRLICGFADRSAVERVRCGFAAGPLPAHYRRTRRKYILVGSYAASMPRKVPRR
ncbi:hypothetical protein XarjCFBP7652_10390 [Xanthomonas arboricola]|nr:hypothetical protein XarbCFBP7629_18025 [Xanthomonas arboricola]PPT48370.1 hypothetical protein XarjCFBP7652_10390 [Xanthomonas arboricola]